jgi:hypothetical protein
VDAAQYSQEGTETERNLFLFLISCSFFRLFLYWVLDKREVYLYCFLLKLMADVCTKNYCQRGACGPCTVLYQ